MEQTAKAGIPRMKELIGILRRADTAYYKYDAPIMTDREYDALYDELAMLEDASGIVISGSPTQDEIVAFAASVRHSLVVLVMAFVMLSGYTCVANQEKEAVRHGADQGPLMPNPGIPACQGDGGARRGKPVPQRVHHGTTYQLL